MKIKNDNIVRKIVKSQKLNETFIGAKIRFKSDKFMIEISYKL